MKYARLTVGTVARGVPCSEQVVRLYADMGLIPCERDSRGSRLFTPEAVLLARTIREQRLANRGRRKA